MSVLVIFKPLSRRGICSDPGFDCRFGNFFYGGEPNLPSDLTVDEFSRMKNAFENLKSFLFCLNFEIKGIRLWGVVEHDFLHISYFLDFPAMSPRMKYPRFSPQISCFAPWGALGCPGPVSDATTFT